MAVLRDNTRLLLPEEEQVNMLAEFVDLIHNCWHQDLTIWPLFLEVMM